MPTFYLQISDGVEAETSIDVANTNEALNAALNALSKFACTRFPPPENIGITVANSRRTEIATLSFEFKIEYAPGVLA